VPLPERLVEIRADEKGFTPERIAARPDEPLLLRFTRADESACAAEVILPGETAKHPLPLRQPVDLRLTAPPSGALVFTCGMKMFTGAVVAE
jgi:plastocyanin domain-containing protein